MSIEETGEDIALSGEVSDADCELFEDFVQYADDLSKTNLVQAGRWGASNYRGTQDSMEVSVELPPWDNVMAFLHRFRPFILQDESTNFYKVCSKLSKQLDHPHFRSLLKQYRELYSGKTLQSALRISHDGVLINSEEILLAWLNAHEYHKDKDKQEYIDSLHRMIPLDASKAIFLKQLAYKATAVFNLAAFIRVVLGKQKSLKSKLRQP